MDAPQSLPSTINWSAISPRGTAIAKQIGMRATAGYSYDEIAEALARDRPNISNLELRPVRSSASWTASCWGS